MVSVRLHIALFAVLYIVKNTKCSDCRNAPKICGQNSDGSCSECIQSHPCCSWCTTVNFTQPRCNTMENLIKMACDRIHTPGTSKIENRGNKNESFKNPDESIEQPAVQIKPQELNLRLRLNDPITFQLQYKAAMNYPFDIYYLMDLTYSMRDNLKTMIDLGSKMATFLETLTKTYRIGFGYFVDKVVRPFSFQNATVLAKHCQIKGFKCEKEYDFIHALNFTGAIEEFTKKLNSSKITANVDDLEGGMDAIMQIVVCDEQMKWRKYSRKIVVVATDGMLHFAGDGILAGITKKNPGVCTVDSDGTYTKGLEYDYPSLEEVYRKLLKHKVNLLFAAKDNVYPYYDQLEQTIPAVTSVGKLDAKSQNIFTLIEKSYKEVVSSVNFEAKTPDGVRITFHSTCNKPNVEKNETHSCDNIKIGQVYTFDVTLTLEEIPANAGDNIILIEEMNLHENVKIKVEYITECECHEETKGIPQCVHGRYYCGKCNCHEGWVGDVCNKECRKNPCRYSNGTYTSSTCFSRGVCNPQTCTCDCDYNHSGAYCEFSQCKRNISGAICSGNGICKEGICDCFDKYTSDDCSCYLGTEDCEIPGQALCNDVGECKCGKCVCPAGYSGQRCEYCPSCTKICDTYDDCVISVAQKKGTDACSGNQTQYETQRVGEIKGRLSAKCLARYLNEKSIQCEVEYSYTVLKDKIKLEYLDPYCPAPFYASVSALIIFITVLLVGIFTLVIWKVHTVRKDKRSYQKFNEQLKKSRFNENQNPLYRSPISEFQNPMNREDTKGIELQPMKKMM